MNPSGRRSIDRYLDSYNFSEFHATRVRAAPEKVYRAVEEVTAGEIRWLELLMTVRSFPAWILRKRPHRPASAPILDLATRGSFLYLAREPPREIVVGTVGQFWKLTGGPPPIRPGSPEAFLAFDDPAYAKAVMNFAVEDAGNGSTLLTTETRIFTPQGHARRRFSIYWRLISPGSALIRVAWLKAIRKRAEAGS